MEQLMDMLQVMMQAQTASQQQSAELIRIIKAQIQLATSQRRIQAIDKLTKREDFPIWRDDIIRVLKRLNLDDYILKDVAEPEGEAEKEKWNNDRADVEVYIRAMVPGQKTWALIKAMG